MKNLYLLTLLCCISSIGYSQEVTILNAYTGDTIQGTICSTQNSKCATSEASKNTINVSAFDNEEVLTVSAEHTIPRNTTVNQLQQKGFVFSLTPIFFDLDEYVVSSSRWRQKRQESPSKVYQIPLEEIQLQNPQTAADLLAISGKVFIQKSQQGGGSPMIRGFATNRLVYTVDGIRMNTAIFRGGNIQNVISLDPFAIENTEVLLGPSSVLYGSDAIGGVMSFQTLTPEFSANGDKANVFGSATSRYSTANQEKTANIKFNIGWEKWAIATSISTNNFDDLKMGSKGPDEYLRPFYVSRIDSTDVIIQNDDPRVQNPSGYSQLNLTQKIRYKPSDKWDFDYGFHYSETSSYSRYDRHIRYKNNAPRYGEWSYGPQTWMMQNLGATYYGNNEVFDVAQLKLAYQKFGESRLSRDFNKTVRETRTEAVDAYSINLDFIKELENSKVFYGLESVVNQVFSDGIDEDISTGKKQAGASRYPRSTWASQAAYLNYHQNLGRKIVVQGGLRYSLVNLNARFDTSFYQFPFQKATINNKALTGSLGFVYRPNNTWVLATNLSRAFRSPNVDDVGKVFDSSPGAVVIPNPNLDPEYATTVDLSLTKIVKNKLKLEAGVYYTWLENALVRRNFQLNSLDSIMYDGELSQVQAIQNAAEATIYGVELGFEYKFGKGFTAMANVNYQMGTEELDNGSKSPSRHVAPLFGVARLEYKMGIITTELYLNFNGEFKNSDLSLTETEKAYLYASDENGLPYSPAWQTLNFKTRIEATKNLFFSAGVENLFDIRYRPYSSGIAASGRNFIIAASLNF